jgi:hypothetical protein
MLDDGRWIVEFEKKKEKEDQKNLHHQSKSKLLGWVKYVSVRPCLSSTQPSKTYILFKFCAQLFSLEQSTTMRIKREDKSKSNRFYETSYVVQ